MSTEASECVLQLVEQAGKGHVSPAQVRSFFQIVHTLKGTASMIKDGEPIVDALHEIEEHLSNQPILESARKPVWLDMAKKAMTQTHATLLELQRRERVFQNVQRDKETSQRGFLTQILMGGKETLLWFPLGALSCVLPSQDLTGKDVYCLSGAWVPVLGGSESQVGFGLGVRTRIGQAVVCVQEIFGVTSWSDAASRGAREGLPVLFGRAENSQSIAA